MERSDRGHSTPKKKRPYEKPSVRAIPLRPDEAVLGVCKSSNSAGAAGAACTVAGVSCSTPGS